MKEPLMSKKEMLAYVAVFAISVAILAITMHYRMPNFLWRIVSLIPAGISFSIWVSMTVGILSAACARSSAE